jgi:hypothetical protein
MVVRRLWGDEYSASGAEGLIDFTGLTCLLAALGWLWGWRIKEQWTAVGAVFQWRYPSWHLRRGVLAGCALRASRHSHWGIQAVAYIIGLGLGGEIIPGLKLLAGAQVCSKGPPPNDDGGRPSPGPGGAPEEGQLQREKGSVACPETRKCLAAKLKALRQAAPDSWCDEVAGLVIGCLSRGDDYKRTQAELAPLLGDEVQSFLAWSELVLVGTGDGLANAPAASGPQPTAPSQAPAPTTPPQDGARRRIPGDGALQRRRKHRQQ